MVTMAGAPMEAFCRLCQACSCAN